MTKSFLVIRSGFKLRRAMPITVICTFSRLSQRSTIVEITMADVITCARRRPLGGAAVAETASDWPATTGSATVKWEEERECFFYYFPDC